MEINGIKIDLTDQEGEMLDINFRVPASFFLDYEKMETNPGDPGTDFFTPTAVEQLEEMTEEEAVEQAVDYITTSLAMNRLKDIEGLTP